MIKLRNSKLDAEEDENDVELIQRFKKCQDTLHKFPLYMEKPEQCGLLQNFNTVQLVFFW